MTPPTIHLNGSSAATLSHDWGEVKLALHDARKKLTSLGPHMRDFYVQTALIDGEIVECGADNHRQAQTEHRSRMDRIQDIIDELEELQCHVLDNR